MKSRVLVDTGPLVAFVNRHDHFHAWVREQFGAIVPPLLTCEAVLTESAYARTIPLARRFTEGVEGVIRAFGLPWHVTQLGCRAEYLFGPDRPRTGAEAHAASNFELERYMHLFALNRGILLTPFHNMALMSPATTEADVDLHTDVFREAVLELAEIT